jgi:signal transduction histidine kinase
VKKLLGFITPDSLAARFVVLLASALIAASLVALLLLASEGRRFDRVAQDAREVDRAITLVAALESVDRVFWKSVTLQASNRFAEASIDAEPVATSLRPQSSGSANGAQRISTMTSALEESVGGRNIAVAILNRFEFRQNIARKPSPDAGQARGGVLAISVQLKTPDTATPAWLNIVSMEGARNAGVGLKTLLTSLALSLTAVLAVGLLFVRQLVRPLSILAEAAKAAGGGDRSARVPVEGAREFRAAGFAFNDMQAKIAGFDAERMRTMGAVGHDLRTPITGMRIRAEMLEDADMRAAFIRALNDMTIMADGLVAFAKGTRDAETIVSIKIVPFLQTLCETHGATWLSGNDNQNKRNATLTVQGRPVALGRAIGNVIANAVRYAASATVRIDLDATTIHIFIEDDGPGIPDEKMESVFEPFVRGEDSRSTETGGAGLGLSISRSIFFMHGGSIALQNKRPQGLRATLTLPRRSAT